MKAPSIAPFVFVAASACSAAKDAPETGVQCRTSPHHDNASLVFDGEADRAESPPLSGGTLAIATRASGAYIMASVAAGATESDRIEIAHLASANGPADVREILLRPGDEPGRIIDDAKGRSHVVLRRSGDVVTFDPETLAITSRRRACSAPRGIAYDGASDSIEVVCATGELVTLPAAGGPATRTVHVERDLRDIVLLGDRTLVTRFRSAEVLTLDALGHVVDRATLPAPEGRSAHVVWRMTERQGTVAFVYQLDKDAPIDFRPTLASGGYGGGYGGGNAYPGWDPSTEGVVTTAIAHTTDGIHFDVDPTRDPLASPAFDVAVSDQKTFATFGRRQLGPDSYAKVELTTGEDSDLVSGRQATAVAFGKLATSDTSEILAVQTREPFGISVLERHAGADTPWLVLASIPIAGGHDTGLDIFHTQTAFGYACASCHPEGGDDAHVWRFIPEPTNCTDSNVVAHRTQAVRGGILKTAPFHWNGDMPGMNDIMSEVFTRRMEGGGMSDAQRAVFAHWIDSIPRLPQRVDLDATRVAAGRAVFEGAGGCSSCHSGPMMTNNATVDVGTGALQVPSLIGVGDRAPFLHDGCAKTLADRFDPSCGGDRHGNTLSDDDRANVIQYLESL